MERGRLGTAVRVGVRSDEGPSALEEEADVMVEGTDGVRDLLRALLGLSVRFGDFLRVTVLLSAGAATLLAALTVIGALAATTTRRCVVFSAFWWAARVADRRSGSAAATRPRRRSRGCSPPPARRRRCPSCSPGCTLLNRLWPLLFADLGRGASSASSCRRSAAIAAGFAIIWALAWRRQDAAVAAIEERDGVRFYVDRTSPLQPDPAHPHAGLRRHVPPAPVGTSFG